MHWQVKPREHRGSTHAWLYVPSECIAPDLLTLELGSTQVWDGDEVKFATQMDVKIQRACAAVLIAGCVGSVAGQVNGVFEPSEEVCG